MVERTVAERVRAQGGDFDATKAERYAARLRSARTDEGDLDIEFVNDELATWTVQKEARFTAGRSITPREDPKITAAQRRAAPERLPEHTATPEFSYDPSDNVLAEHQN